MNEANAVHVYEKSMDEKVKFLSDVFPDHDMEVLIEHVNTSDNLADAAESLLSTMEKKCEQKVLSSTSSSSGLTDEFGSLKELLFDFQLTVIEDILKLEVNRSEIWRIALAFYKKCINKPNQLKRTFEVCALKFSNL